MSFGIFTEERLGEETGRIITFLITMVSMIIGYTQIPFLPTPLPVIIGFLVAYTIYKKKVIGSISGSMLISLGVFYHLSRLGFFQLFTSPLKNVVLMTILFAPFLICPVTFTTNLQIIAMDMGIIAVSLLFFKQTFFLAIPLLLVFATVYKGKGIVYSFIYYIFMSMPLQLMQYLKTYTKGAVPPLYTPLDIIHEDLQSALSTVSVRELSKVINTITGFANPEVMIGVRRAAVRSFVNSLPGIALFFIIMSGMLSVLAILNMKMPDPVKQNVVPGKYMNVMLYTLPIIAAAITNGVFFIAINSLQAPLNYQATVNRSILLGSTTFTVLFSAPVSLSKYFMDVKEVKVSRRESVKKLSTRHLGKMKRYIRIVDGLGNPVPENFIELRAKMLITRDELEDMNRNSRDAETELTRIDDMLLRLVKVLNDDMEQYESHLNVALKDYYIKEKFEYLESISELTGLGIDIEAPQIPEMVNGSTLEEKVHAINEVIASGHTVVKRLIETSDIIYEIISSLFEPNLPRSSATLTISREKIEEDEPWVIVDAILVSLKNWERQYSADIVKATRPINESMETILELRNREGMLRPLIGEDFDEIERLSQQMTEKSYSAAGDDLNVLRVIQIRDTIFRTVTVVGGIIRVLYTQILQLEESIESLLPREDYEWNRNTTLNYRMKQSLDVIDHYDRYEIDDIVSQLYRVLSYIEEAVETIEYYSERREMLLNYTVFSRKISRIIAEKGEVTLDELGVSEKYGREYLKLFYRTSGEFRLEETQDALRRSSS